MGVMAPAPALRSGGFRYATALRLIAALVVMAAPLWFSFLLSADIRISTPWDSATILLLMFLAFSAVALVSQNDGVLRRVMMVGLLYKMAACAASLYLALYVYNGSADALSYSNWGRRIATRLLYSGEWTVLQPVWGTNFVRMVTACLFLLIGPSLAAGTVAFALIAFWGQYLCYRAFCYAFPARPEDRHFAAMLIFLLPSLVFWSSSIGKDALAGFFIGLVCYGYARLGRKNRPTFYLPLVLGVIGVLLVRPHVALMLGIALTFPYVIARSSSGMRGARLLMFPLFLAATLYLAVVAKEFLELDDISKGAAVVSRINASSNVGGSSFGGEASGLARVLAIPVLFFRPFPWEIHNLQAAVASVEGMLLLVLCYRNRRQIITSIRGWRSTPFTVFILGFLVEFSVIFSAAIANFGLLARERIMATPLLLMLMCVRAREEITRPQQPPDLAGPSQEPIAENATVAPVVRGARI